MRVAETAGAAPALQWLSARLDVVLNAVAGM
jgi:hypothetical protein